MPGRHGSPEEIESTGLAAPSSVSLITYIRKRDDLPSGWILSKRTRRSAGDIQELTKVLERQHGINQSSGGVPQASSMPASPVSPTETHPDDRESLALPSDVRGRLDEIGAGTAITDMKDSLLALARDGLSSAAAMTALYIFWPTVIFLTVWMILQALAIGYSTSYTAVLAFTCQHRIPYIMDGICKSYDLPVKPQGSPAKQLNLSFGNLLQDNRMNISFETPYFISRYQTMARGFRAALPDVMLAEVDTVWIEGRLNISIN